MIELKYSCLQRILLITTDIVLINVAPYINAHGIEMKTTYDLCS
jgi:hypothetical protein